MNVFAVSSLLIFISTLSLAIFLFLKGRDKELCVIWGWFCILIAIWGLGGFKFSTTLVEKKAFFWWQIGYVAVILSPVMYSHFVFSYVGLKQRKAILSICYIFASVFLFLNFFVSDLFLGDVKFVFGQFYWHDWGQRKNLCYLIFYIGFHVFLVLFSLSLLVKQFFVSQGVRRYQLKYFILASIIGWLGPLGDFLIDFGITSVYPYSNFFIALFPFIIAYTIIRYRLMDINIVIKKGLIYSVLVAVISCGYLLFVIGVEKLFRGVVGYQSFIANLGAIIILGLLFNPLRDGIQRFLDKRFFHGTLESLAREQQRLQQELYQSQKLAYVGQLASSIVHEVRNPLTSIQAYVKYLPEKYHDPDFKRKFNSLVPRELERIENVVNQLLDLGKPGQRKIANVNICSLIDSTLCLIEDHIKLKNITVKKHFESEEIFVQADEEQLRQVFLNLFLNAIQAMGDAGEFEVVVQISDDRIKIEIADNGCGMTEETRKKIFTPFFTTKEDGVGLGMQAVSQPI